VNFPNRADVTTTNAKATVVLAASAVENVNVRDLLVRMRLVGRNLVVLWMPATRGNLLVMLQRLDVFRRQKPEQLLNRIAAAGENVRHAMVKTDAPKSTVNVSPVATVNVVP
jgi:hypothetical protein